MENRKNKLGALVIALLAVGCCLATVWAFKPGYMSFDSFSQLQQARSGVFTDWHPVVMSLLWGVLDRLAPGPIGMLVLHNVMFFGGLALLIGRRFGAPVASILLLLVAPLPPVFGLLSTVWKDVALGASLTLATGAMVWASDTHSKPALWFALAPLAFGTAVRHEAILATLPLALWWGHLFSSMCLRSPSRGKTVAAGSVVCALVLTVAPLASRLVECSSKHPIQQLFLQDLIGLSRTTRANLLPPPWRGDSSHLQPALLKAPAPAVPPLEQLIARYDPRNNVAALYDMPWTESSTDVLSLGIAWLKAVVSHPLAYLRQRWALAKAQFGLDPDTYYPFHSGVDDLEPKVTFVPSALNARAMSVLSATRNSLLFRPFFWMLIAAASVVAAVVARRVGPATIAVAASCFGYGLVHVFISTVADFRLVWWSVISAILCVILAASDLVGRRGNARPAV